MTAKRWRVLLFEDRSLFKILDLRHLRAQGLFYGSASSPRPHGTIVQLDESTGHAMDILAFQDLREAHDVLRGQSTAPHDFAIRGFDFAFLDWKDENAAVGVDGRVADGERSNEGSGQLMGFLLGFQARRANPDCTLVLMSNYTEEVKTLFEPRWAREILGDSESGTLTLVDDPLYDKLNIFQHPFLLKEERKKAVEYILQDSSRLAATCERLEQLPSIVASIPGEFFTNPANTDLQEGKRRERLAEAIRTTLAQPVHDEILPWLFPFSFAAIHREIQLKSQALVVDPLGRLTLDALDAFRAHVLPTLLGSEPWGRDIIARVASREYFGARGVFPGWHPRDGQEVQIFAEQMPSHLDALVSEVIATGRLSSGDELVADLLSYKVAITDVSTQLQNGIVEDDAAKASVNEISHNHLRFAPIRLLEEVFNCTAEVGAAAAPSQTVRIAFRPGHAGDKRGTLNRFELYGPTADVRRALQDLKSALRDESPSLSGTAYYFGEQNSNAEFVQVRLTIESSAQSLQNLERLAALEGGGDLNRALSRLSRYFGVAIGNDRRVITYPVDAGHDAIGTGPLTVLLHFTAGVRTSRGLVAFRRAAVLGARK